MFEDWSRREFLVRGGLALGTAASLEAFLAACGGNGHTGSTGGTRIDGGTLIVAFPSAESQDLQGMDPTIGGGTTYTNSIMGAMFDQLVWQDPGTGKVVPGLAERWEMSSDGLQYTFHMNPKCKFWDGSPVTAEDAQFMFDRGVAKIPPSSQFNQIDHSELIDEMTVRVHLKAPQANFLWSSVARTYLAVPSKAWVKKVGEQAANQKPLGSGAYQFVEWVHGDHITVKRNPNYTWGPSFFQTAGRPPSPDQIIFHYIQDDSTRLAALQSGSVNAIQLIPAFDQAALATDSRFSVMTVRKNGQPGGMDLHMGRFPSNDLAVRQALAYAVDREAINKAVYANTNWVAYHFLEDRMGSWVNQKAVLPKTDVNKAKQVLDQAGWTVGSDGIRAKNGQRLLLDAFTDPTEQQLMTLVQAQAKQAGIQLNVNTVASAQQKNITGSVDGKYNVVWNANVKNGLTNEDPNCLYSQFSSDFIPPKGQGDFPRYQSAAFDADVKGGLTTSDPAKRQAYYYAAQEELFRDLPTISLISFNQNWAMVKGVNGISPDIRGTYTYFHDVWLDKSIQK